MPDSLSKEEEAIIIKALANLARLLSTKQVHTGKPVYLFAIDKKVFCLNNGLNNQLFVHFIYHLCNDLDYDYVCQCDDSICELTYLSRDPNMHYFVKRRWKCVRNPLIELDIDSVKLQKEYEWIKED